MSKETFEDNIQLFINELKDEDQMTEKQRQILQAAIKLFAEKGFSASSTAEIAKEAGVAEGTIFRHYKSKKDILIAAVAPMVVKIAAPFVLKDIRSILTTHSDRSLADIFADLYKNRLDLIETNGKHARILLQEAFFHEELRDAVINNIAKEAKRLGTQFAESRIASGELRPLPPDAVTRAFISMLLGLLLFKNVIAPEEYQQRTEDEQIALTVDILLNGIANRT
ncbi:MAG: TetR/AcrR family transcriptional regulator [Clostridia bacterium]